MMCLRLRRSMIRESVSGAEVVLICYASVLA
jgi:hypothetical protein